ncbi:peptidase C65 Otubain-domain-containing protein [Fusarium acuminatum]|uniref:Peptidase C65 Otubain-domain-containing protein n=1 Tax=Fusarium acuminatum TaxID=5515 RepID=A0ABZ2WJS2_9HYPO
MFQPQPTPFASSSFVSYGLASDLDFAYPVSAGGGFYNSPAPAPAPASAPATSQHLPQSHTQSHPTLQSQSQSRSQPQSQPSLIQQRIPRQQLSSSAVAPSVSSPYSSSQSSSSPTLAQPQTRQSLPHQQLDILSRQQPAQQQQYATQSGPALLKMDEQGLHDFNAQQAAAQDYQAELEVNGIVAELSPLLSPIGFSYFEKLVESGDQAKIESEVARLMSMNHLLSTVGNYQYYEDWADEMLDLLREVAQNMNNPHLAQVLIQEKWNDPGVADSLIYYLRLLAGTYLKANAATYDPFITEYNGVQGYCSQCIDIPNREIEHIGIEALSNVLLKPVDFVLEIAYLDRSPGARVNTHRFPGETNGQDINNLGTVIYLLFRPGHYDILYKGDTMQVFRVNGFTHNTNITTDQADLGQYTTMNFDALSIIPGFSNSASLGGLGQIAPPPNNSMSESFSPVQQSPWMSSFPESLPSSTQRIMPPQPQPIMASPQPPTPPASISSSSAIAPSPAMGSASGPGPQSSLPLRTASSYHIRFSPVQLDYDESKNNFPESTFQVTTNTFKNSIWNRAHYCNPNFHPEEWSPDDEHTDGRVGGKRKMKKEIS